jgi:hypothetical protein
MPSLLQEKQVGFDVSFNSRGVPLLLQFKLGQSPKRFVRSDKSQPAPALEKPFFRFSIDTSEPDGQFETLLKAEADGAEVYYIAPRFTDWPQYVSFFEEGEILQRSVMVTPGEIRSALVVKGVPDGAHRIVYDQDSVHVCSTPTSISDVRPDHLAEKVSARLRSDGETLRQTVFRLYAGLDDRAAIRREEPSQEQDEGDEDLFSRAHMKAMDERTPPQITRLERRRRLTQLKARSRSEDDAVAAALGLEFWGLGIQLIFAVTAPADATTASA